MSNGLSVSEVCVSSPQVASLGALELEWWGQWGLSQSLVHLYSWASFLACLKIQGSRAQCSFLLSKQSVGTLSKRWSMDAGNPAALVGYLLLSFHQCQLLRQDPQLPAHGVSSNLHRRSAQYPFTFPGFPVYTRPDIFPHHSLLATYMDTNNLKGSRGEEAPTNAITRSCLTEYWLTVQ